jgi:hypothetical protein
MQSAEDEDAVLDARSPARRSNNRNRGMLRVFRLRVRTEAGEAVFSQIGFSAGYAVTAVIERQR